MLHECDVSLLGYLCDIIGARPISLLASLLFVTAYILAAQAFQHALPLAVFLVAFFLVGMGTSSLYFSALTTSAKNFVGHRGLSIAVPIAAFGLSSFWEALLAGSPLFTKHPQSESFSDDNPVPLLSTSQGELDVVRLFYFFAILLGIVGVIGSFGLITIPPHLPKRIPGEEPTEDDALLPRAEESETSSVISIESAKEELTAEHRPFLRDSSTWLFGLSLLVLLGSGEMFINCVCTLSLTTSFHTFLPPPFLPSFPPALFSIPVNISRCRSADGSSEQCFKLSIIVPPPQPSTPRGTSPS
jgi:MFS family permease